MKISEILSILDLSKKEPFYITYDFLNEFDIQEYEIDLEKFKSKLSYIWIVTWYCTDTWVGIKVLLVNDDPMCIITQVARKCIQEFEWISNNSFFKVKAGFLAKDYWFTEITNYNWWLKVDEFYCSRNNLS